MRERGQQRGVRGEDVRGVEEGGRFAVDADAGAQDGWVEGSSRGDGGEARGGGEFGEAGARGRGQEEGVDLVAQFGGEAEEGAGCLAKDARACGVGDDAVCSCVFGGCCWRRGCLGGSRVVEGRCGRLRV